jgi:hypothetical protein
MSSSQILHGTQHGVPGHGISAPTQIPELRDSLDSPPNLPSSPNLPR